MSELMCSECKKCDGDRCTYFDNDMDRESTIACILFEPKKPTLFDRITASPEVLAEKVVYLDGISFTSPFIDDAYFVGKEKGESWEERYFKARDKAIDATIAKLNKVVEHE